MSLLNRRTLLLMPLAVAACGFTPVYGPGGTGSALHNRILVQAPDSTDSYVLVRELEQRLGRGTAPDFRLDYSLTTTDQGQAITVTNFITRYSLVGKVTYSLVRLSDGKVINSGTTENFTGYSATGSTVDTLAAERDAHERLMVILADQITAHLVSTTDLSE